MLKTKDFLFPAILFSCLFISLSGWITPVSAQNCNTITSIISTNSISLVCRDQNPTEIIFSHSQISQGNYIYLVTRQNGLLIETFEQNHYDFNELPADHYLVYGAHYQGELTAEPGQFLHQISATVCLTMSTNSYPVQVREMVLKSETLTDYNGFPVSTHDSNDGAVKVKVEKESGDFLYEWNTHPPQYTQTATQLEGGAYLVKVTDSLGCEATLEIILESPDAVRGEFHLVEPISCQGAGDGSLEVSATGGVAPYTYSWHHNGQAQAKLDGLAAGVYRATITDANGAEELTNFTLTDPKPLVTEATVFNNDCPGMQNGMIIMAVSGGAAPYVCSWSTGDTGAELVGLTGGEYEVTIIDSNQCVQKERYVVKEADSMIISAMTTPDNGAKTGTIQLNIEGGNSPYQFYWGNGDSTDVLTGLEAGNYPVSIIDSLGCQTEFQAKVESVENPTKCIEVHTGFSPNGDGINETWYLPCITSYPNNEVMVFNRWGQELFAISNYDNSWNGTSNGRPLPDGTYFYLIKLPQSSGKKQLKGTVIIR